MKVSIIVAGLLLSGCSVHSAIIADSATTAYAISEGHTESNPIYSDKSAAITSAAFKYSLLYAFKNTQYCKPITKGIYSASIAGATNNIGVINGSDNSKALGIGAGIFALTQSNRPADSFCD